MSNYDYVIAKLHGIHSKSIIGENFKRLKQITNIEKLHKELFPNDLEPVSTRRLYSRVEKLFKDKIYQEICNISKFFDYRNDLINSVILGYEIDNIKILVKSHLSGVKSVSNLFEVKMKKRLDYNLLYSVDISDFRNIQRLLNPTWFKFVLPLIEQRKDIFIIENELDKFYYKNILDALKRNLEDSREILARIIREEMNWQNIMWAFRTRLYYSKAYNDIKDTFIKSDRLLSSELLKRIFELQFIPNEASRIFKDFPDKYRDVILKAFKENGDVDLPALEEMMNAKLAEMYMKYFFKSNDILAVVSFIYIKKDEYVNVVKLVESLRYNLKAESS
jgi:vacuolar-type H+-ATPase subunit C/Vma6